MVADEAALWLRANGVVDAVNGAAGWLHAEAPNPYDVFVDDPVRGLHLILSAQDWSRATWADPATERLSAVDTGLSRDEPDPHAVASWVLETMGSVNLT